MEFSKGLHSAMPCRTSGRAKNKASGLGGQAEILIGHLYNLIQSWSNFWMTIVENCMESHWPAAILSSEWYVYFKCICSSS